MLMNKFSYMNARVRRKQMKTVADQHNALINGIRDEIEHEIVKLSRKVGKVSTTTTTTTTTMDPENHILSIVTESPPTYAWTPLTPLTLRDRTTDTSNGNADALWKLVMSSDTDSVGQLVLIKL